MKTAIIIQARLGSKRFPRKVLADFNGKPILQHVIDRCRQIELPIILATPDRELAAYDGLDTFIGSEDDVLSRYAHAAKAFNVDLIMRITADCPLLRPDLCQETLKLYHESKMSYVAIGWPMTFPKGYGCEVFSRSILELTDALATDQQDREHVTPWMECNLACRYLTQANDESHLNYSVDTPSDLERLRALVR